MRFVDSQDPANFAAAADENTRAFFTETVSNPALEVADLEGIAEHARACGVPLIVDSTFSTPYLTRPLEHGADIVVHSLTKWFGGHGTGIGGVVVDSGRFNWGAGKHPLYDTPDTSYHGLRWGHDLPPELAPLAFILRMRTVPLRNLGRVHLAGQCLDLPPGHRDFAPPHGAPFARTPSRSPSTCRAHPAVEWVRFPGLPDNPEFEKNKKYIKGKGGAMVVFGIKGGADAGKTFIESLELHSHLANVGDAKSLAIHPATTTHSQLDEAAQADAGITPELVRLAVGIEHIDDILADLDQALAKATA